MLTIYWDGEEVPGFIVFALGSHKKRAPALPDFGWPIAPDVRFSTLTGERWLAAVWYVSVTVWPSAQRFQDSLRHVLAELVGDGYSVAWIGTEGSFADPPSLFNPKAMSGRVLAANSRATGFIASFDLDTPLKALTDAEMLRLREASGGLATSV